MTLLKYGLCVLSAVIISSCANNQTYSSRNSSEAETKPFIRITANPNHNIDRIAVTVLGVSGTPTTKVENIAIEKLERKGYAIAGRSDLKRVLDEQHIQASQLTEGTNAVITGNILNVDALFIVEVTELKYYQYGGHIHKAVVVGRLVDAIRGNVIWVKNADVTANGILLLPLDVIRLAATGTREDPLSAAVEKLMTYFPPHG